ncbi:hypothetical protein EXU85_32025 [Spirosoma sp. KCTC 42546]|nr:hypothetical protein EXU85_32025 [Spirosoma sp. KCTC 42546]
MLFFYVVESHDIVKNSYQRQAFYTLSNGKQNLTSLYFEQPGYKRFCFGYPNAKLLLQDGTKNPALSYRHDAYLFICDWQQQVIELIVVQNGKPFIKALYCDLIGGNYDGELRGIRANVRPYYLYNCL